MLWQRRGRYWPPEPHEDNKTPPKRSSRIKQKRKSHEWTSELGADINTSAAISSNDWCSNSYKWCCLPIGNVALVSSKPFVVSGSCGDDSTVDVQRFTELIDYVPYSCRGFDQQSTVSSYHADAAENIFLSSEMAILLSTRVGSTLPRKSELKSAQPIAIFTTLSRLTGANISENWYCHKGSKANDTNSIDAEYVCKRQQSDCKVLLTAASALSSHQASLASVRSSPQQKFHSRSCHGLSRHFTSLNFIVTSLLLMVVLLASPADCGHSVHCGKLLIGQYRCPDPEIDVVTQQVLGCFPNNSAPVVCTLAPELFCREGTGINETHFISEVECEWTNGYSFEFSLLLSVFLGWLGLDRLYLGYPGLALAKFCTLGGIFLWQLIDIVLIAMQVVRPADGSQYVVSYFGPRLTRLALNNDTQILAQDDW